MSLFASFGNELSYEDVIQLDGAFAATHVNYGKAPLFNGAPHEDSNWESRKEFIFSSVSSNLSRYHRSPGLVPAISKRRYRE